MAKKYRLICWFVLVMITLTAMSFAERPMVVVGNQSLDATVRSLLSDGIQLAVVPFPTETATTAESSQLIGTVLSARVTILDKSAADPMLVERLLHQGAPIAVIEHSSNRLSPTAMQVRLRTIHRVLVQRFPEHESELTQSLDGELRKLRVRRAINFPRTELGECNAIRPFAPRIH